jgi:pyruvate/2-oxoglutarate dehydrogenase complex dihydrolipoamide acyltransferase (E2) component
VTQIILPELGEGIMAAEIVRWHVTSGERVGVDDDLVELVTDKAVFNVPAPCSGILGRVHFMAGTEAPVGAVLGEIKEEAGGHEKP